MRQFKVLSPKDRALSCLEQYDADQINFVAEYKDYIDNLEVIDISPEEPELLPLDDEIKNAKIEYLSVGVGEGLIDSEEQFDEILSCLYAMES